MDKSKSAALILIVAILIVGLILIGVLVTSPTLELIKAFATPVTAWFITPIVTKELEEQKRKSSEDQNKQEALKDYFKQITILLVDKKLSEQSHDSVIGQTAKALTLSVLRELDLNRKKQLIEFLKEIKLVQFDGENKTPALLKNSDLSKLDLSELDLSKVDLSGSNLSQSNLSKTNLSHANLSEANLSHTDLSYANLSEANLSHADLSYANLSEANLSHARLIKANLSHARLTEAKLIKAILIKANLTHAMLGQVFAIKTNNKYNKCLENGGAISFNRNGIKIIARYNVDDETICHEYKLNDSDIQGVMCNAANLSEADLSNADLSNADLSSVNFSRANLSGTNLSGTNLHGFKNGLEATNKNTSQSSIFFGKLEPDFDQVENLDKAKYTQGHKYIDDTIFPENFNPEIEGMIKIEYQADY